MDRSVYALLEMINTRPKPFQYYTARELWTNAHTSRKMLEYHLNPSMDLSSRNHAFIARSVAWIVSSFHIDGSTRIADFGCGPGLYTTAFAEHNARVTGIDFSTRSIGYARKTAEQKGLAIRYHAQDYLEFETDERFDLITLIFCDFCALSPVQRRNLLAKFYRFLKPGGALLLDVHSLNTFNNTQEKALYARNLLDHFWSADDYYCFLNTFKYEREKVTLDKYTIIEQARTRVVYNWLQYFSRDALQQEVEAGGFRIEGFFSDVAGKPFSAESPDMAIIAKKAEHV